MSGVVSWARRRIVVPASLAVVPLAGLSAAVAFAATRPAPQISACVQRRSGVMYMARRCRRGDRRVVWSVRGPQGVRGLRGLVGRAGAVGPAGPAGVTGAQGAAGLSGATGARGPVGGTGATGPAGPGAQSFTASGSYTVPSGVSMIEVEVWGAGGGGGGAANNPGGGGGGGATVIATIPVSAGSSCTVTVGAGGSGGSLGYDGTSGQDSSVSCANGVATANGGGYGTYSGSGGAGGASAFSNDAVALMSASGSQGQPASSPRGL